MTDKDRFIGEVFIEVAGPLVKLRDQMRAAPHTCAGDIELETLVSFLVGFLAQFEINRMDALRAIVGATAAMEAIVRGSAVENPNADPAAMMQELADAALESAGGKAK